MKLKSLYEDEDFSYPSLEEFITSALRNSYITFTSSKGYIIESYVRKSSRILGEKRYDKVLDRANTKINNDEIVLKMIKQNKYMSGTGAYKEFDQFMLVTAKQHKFDAIFVEQVINPQLLEVLKRWGYIQIENTPSFYKLL